MTESLPEWKLVANGLATSEKWFGRTRATRRTRSQHDSREPLDDLIAPVREVAIRWAKKDAEERQLDGLMRDVPVSERVHAEHALDLLVNRGWVELIERYKDGSWRRSAIGFLDLEGLREELGIVNDARLWRDAVVHVLGQNPDAAAVSRQAPLRVSGMDPIEVVTRLKGAAVHAASGGYLRALSALLFDGRSKILDGRGALVAAILGAESCPFQEPPIRLEVHIPASWVGEVLFIENPLAFEAARRAPFKACQRMALVLAQGFMASARRVRQRQTATIYAQIPVNHDGVVRFERWLFAEEAVSLPIFFWGDLDYSGMHILRELAPVFPGIVAWQAGYEPMVQCIREGRGHPPQQADKENQTPPSSTSCAYADSVLIPAMLETGLFYDQEGVVPGS